MTDSIICPTGTGFETIFVERDDESGSTFTIVNGFVTVDGVTTIIERWLIPTWQCCTSDGAPVMYMTIEYQRKSIKWKTQHAVREELRYDGSLWGTTISDGCWMGPDTSPYSEYLDRIIREYDGVGLEVLSSGTIECAQRPDVIWIRSESSPEWEIAQLWIHRNDGYGTGTYSAPLVNAVAADHLRWPFDISNGDPQWEFLSLGTTSMTPQYLADDGSVFGSHLRNDSRFITAQVILKRSGSWGAGTWSYNGVITGKVTSDLYSGTALDHVLDACGATSSWVEAKLGIYSDPEVTIGRVVRIESSGNAPDCDSGYLVWDELPPLQVIPPGTYKVYLTVKAKIDLVEIKILGQILLLGRTLVFLEGIFTVSASVTLFDGPVYDLGIPIDSWRIDGIFNTVLEELSSNIVDGILSLAGPKGVALASILDVTLSIRE
jgi:hypothetical protein